MKRNIIQLKDDNGNVFYPQTHEKAVIDSSGKSLDEKLADKQDKIDDLTSIRNGSSAGATAYQKPASGIPASDIASGVIPDISGKQDAIEDLSTIRSGAAAGASAYQKPSSGIPASDIASGVIPDVSGKQDALVSGTNIKTVNGESLLGSGNITAGDPNAVKYVSQSLTDSQKAQARANIGAADAINGIDSVAVSVDNTSGSPEAEVSLVNHELTISFYGLKGEQGNTGSSVAYPYELVNNRTTNDATKGLSAAEGKRLGDDLSQLEAEVHNLSGKFYGVFADDSDLPEGDAVGYAFVGTENPYAIWNFDGEDWSDSGSVANGITGEPGVGFSSIFTPDPYDGTVIIVLSNNDTITLDLNHNHPAYYSKVAETSNPSGGFLPDVVYSLGTLTGTITFALAAAVTGNVNHYFWMFDTGSTAPTITWPTGITWADGSAPTVAASKHYEISVLDGVAYYSEV